MTEPQADPVARVLYAQISRYKPTNAPDSQGRQRWEIAWAEGDAKRGQVWFGTLDDLTTMALRNGFSAVDVRP